MPKSTDAALHNNASRGIAKTLLNFCLHSQCKILRRRGFARVSIGRETYRVLVPFAIWGGQLQTHHHCASTDADICCPKNAHRKAMAVQPSLRGGCNFLGLLLFPCIHYKVLCCCNPLSRGPLAVSNPVTRKATACYVAQCISDPGVVSKGNLSALRNISSKHIQ